jgi:hypothetical protein
LNFSQYHFVSHWQVKGPIEVVFEILKDGPNYPQWWKPAYVNVREIGEKKVRALVRAKLPYTLEFTTEIVREDPPTAIELKAGGELVGAGLWTLRQIGDTTDIQFLWDVRTEKPWVRFLSPLLKPIFKWNHDWVMKTGETGLRDELKRRLNLSSKI